MTETIADVAVRLAREQLAAEKDKAPELLPLAQAEPPLAGILQQPVRSDLPAEAVPAPPPLCTGSAGDRGVSSGQATTPNPTLSDSPAAFGLPPRASLGGLSGSPLVWGEDDVRAATVFESDDAPQSAPPSGKGAGDRGVPQLVETIGEHGRRIEEVLSELERSLTTMFNTQLEAFRQLRDYAQDQERRWVEQTANRRAAFSPP